MNVFVLCTGRCGSQTFAAACRHSTNYTVGHESQAFHRRLSNTDTDRIAYPKYHIEVDNRLAWFLGRLDARYGNTAYYVHLQRDVGDVVKSFITSGKARKANGIIGGYRRSIVNSSDDRMEDVIRDYVDTVTANIQLFLRDKTWKREMWLGSLGLDFRDFWSDIHAEGDVDAAMRELKVHHGASPTTHQSTQ